MKMPLKHHEENLKNQKVSLERTRIEMERARARYERDLADMQFYEHQINHAKATGKDGFDRDRYMVKTVVYLNKEE